MKKLLSRNLVTAMVTGMMLALLSSGQVIGQEDAKKPAATKKVAKKPRGRLPSYFAAVVSQKQREEVYTIQAKYSKQLADLQKQIAELKAQMTKEVDAVLTPEQLEEVNKKREEAAAKRRSGAKKKPQPEKK